jgi:MFS family permease
MSARLASLETIHPRRRALMATLFAAQVCGSTGHSVAMAVGGIMAAAITGTNTWAGVPVGLGALGAALAAWPLSRLMERSGRRPGLALGYGIAVGGALLSIAGVFTRSFPLFLVGMTLFGISNTSNLLARYAAADVSPGSQRGRAMGLIVWGSTVGSILGPNLMAPAVHVGKHLGISPVGSAFLISVAGYGLAAILVQIFLRPDPLAVARQIDSRAAGGRTHRTGPRRSPGVILREPRVRLAFLSLMLSQLVMIGTTSTSPVYLHDQGHAVHTLGLAVSFHLGGMYVASPLSGLLADRLGRVPMIGVGGLVLMVALAVAGLAPGSDSGLVILGLFLNGIGWNFAFVAASTLLTDELTPEERASIQGMADLAMGLMGALASALGGIILGKLGFGALNALGAVVTLNLIGAAWLQRGSTVPPPAPMAPSRRPA